MRKEGRLRVLVVLVGVLAIVMIAANCERKAAEDCIWHSVVSLIFLMIWHHAKSITAAVMVLTRVAWMGSWLWKQEPKLHGITWAFEAIMSLWHLSALLTVLGHLAVYGGFLRAKIRVSELEVRYTVPEVKGGDGAVVIQTPFGKIVTDASHLRVGQEYSRGVRDILKDMSQRVLVPGVGKSLGKSLEIESRRHSNNGDPIYGINRR
jgi:hypothetical protein